MRNRTTLTVLFMGLIFGIAGTAYVNNKAKATRSPASLDSTAKKIPWMPPPLGKHLSLLKVEITTPHNVPETGSDDVAISGRILINQELQGDLTYAWTLPEDVKVVEGHLNDRLSNVKLGQIVEVNLVVSGFNKEKQRTISLQASAHQGSTMLGNSAVLTSRPEDTWEAVAPEMRQAAQEQLGTDDRNSRRDR